MRKDARMFNHLYVKNSTLGSMAMLWCLLLMSGQLFADSCTGDCINGQGTLTRDNGSKYIGGFRNGKVDGRGTIVRINGDKYTMDFKNGNVIEPIKNMIVLFANGNKYVGDAVRGTSTFTDGTTYVGDMKDGKISGKGTMTFSNGQKYIGEWRDGVAIEGRGSWYLADGSRYTKSTFNWRKIATVIGAIAVTAGVIYSLSESRDTRDASVTTQTPAEYRYYDTRDGQNLTGAEHKDLQRRQEDARNVGGIVPEH